MIARILHAGLLAGVTCAWVAPPAIADAPAGSTGAGETHGILFEIRPPTGAPPSFLFGTIHSEDVRVVDLPAPVREAFDASPNVALEVVPDAAAIIRAMITMAFTDGRLLRDVLPADLYLETAAALGDIGMPEEAFKDLKPWAVVTLLSSPPSETGEFLDMLLYRRAIADGKRVEGLETMTEQLAVFDALPETDQITLLRETLASREHLPRLFEALIAAYAERDVEALQQLSERHLADTDPRLAALFQTVVIDSRNHRMVERMAPLLAEGGWFVAIGALHLPGKQGVIELLRRLDYQVTVAF
ncbi:TraB/GumN family protein [Thiocapsa marina]|uniref:GumN family protein n=1 Tax=Thiocapsa marina 5811 TaxID=768671 RepID=F9UGJ5_9GAMM|nr:TraB/GumN family protein [Thiocapsa marina]EGV16678.1 GumN family protein [Thiocapsa marina 5811]